VSAETPETHAAPQSTRPPAARRASLATALLVGSACSLAVLLVIGPPLLAFIAAVPICLTAASGCLLMSRLELTGAVASEPWRLDAWALSIAGFGFLALGLSVGPETKVIGWLVVAMMISLTLAG
jgi:hypothetical protein